MTETKLDVVRDPKRVRERIADWRARGMTVAVVPTMGALHEGHLSLVRRGQEVADRTVASVFVNPAQFAPGEDFDAYPRGEAQDFARLADVGCDLAYAPPRSAMYPDGFATSVRVDAYADILCAASRPHFFGGVATVVTKLLNQCRPDVAVFGEKDYQQLLIVRRLARDLDLDVEIVGAPIVREPDGLAMSSRNAYLTTAQRAVAGRLNAIMAAVVRAIEAGEPIAAAIAAGRADLNAAGFDRIDYLEARDAADLSAPGDRLAERHLRLFAAVYLGETRLIDNRAINARGN
ncbi:MAG: pantoate--beta-alanine ligase [Pseudomonadota bacterium]